MRIVFVCDEYPPYAHGGSGSSYKDLAEGLVEAGHDVVVTGIYRSIPSGRPVIDERINGVRVLRLAASPSWLRFRGRTLHERWRLLRCLRKLDRAQAIDLVECSDYAGWLPFGGPHGVPVVVRIRGSNLFFDRELGRTGNRFEHWIERRTLCRAMHIAAVSRYAAEATFRIAGMSDVNWTLLYNAVDTDQFSPGPEAEIVPGMVLFVNSISPKKGIAELMRAMERVKEAHREAQLVVIGEEPDGGTRLRDELLRGASERVRNATRFAGRLPREEVCAWLRRAAVCVYPSHMETFGIAALEAMATARPVVFSRTGPGPEVVEQGVSGLLCDPRDPEDIARQICLLLREPALARRLAANARHRVEQLFERNGWIERNLAFYGACVRKSR